MERKSIVRKRIRRADLGERKSTLGDRFSPVRKIYKAITQEDVSAAIHDFRARSGLITQLPAELVLINSLVRITGGYGAFDGEVTRRRITLDK